MGSVPCRLLSDGNVSLRKEGGGAAPWSCSSYTTKPSDRLGFQASHCVSWARIFSGKVRTDSAPPEVCLSLI